MKYMKNKYSDENGKTISFWSTDDNVLCEDGETLRENLDEVDTQFKEKANKNELKVHFIRLNNFGESILVQFGNKNILIDFGQVTDEETIVSYLRKNNVFKLDYIIITHYHSDHIGSLEYVLNNMNISECVAYLPCEPNFDKFNKNGAQFKSSTLEVYNILNNKNIEKIFPYENQIINLGEINLKFNNCNSQYFESYYNTVSEYATNGETDYNNFSLVTTILHEDVKILLTSDINIPAQEKIIDNIEKCNVYKTEHHSTNSLISEDFFNKVNPEISVCCNVEQSSIFSSQISLYHFKNKKEYYLTHKGDVVVCSNGNIAYVKTNNKRFEGEIDTFYNFQSIMDNYNKNTELIEIVRAMPSNSKLLTAINKDDAVCPIFVSDYNATIEIYKVTSNKATLTIKDFNYNEVKVYEGIWHSSNGDTIKWGSVRFENQKELITYRSMNALYSLGVNDSSDALTILKVLPTGGFYSGIVKQTFASFLSSWGGMATIEKLSTNQGRIILSDSNSNLGKTWIGLYHSTNGDVIKWSLLNSTMV